MVNVHVSNKKNRRNANRIAFAIGVFCVSIDYWTLIVGKLVYLNTSVFSRKERNVNSALTKVHIDGVLCAYVGTS